MVRRLRAETSGTSASGGEVRRVEGSGPYFILNLFGLLNIHSVFFCFLTSTRVTKVFRVFEPSVF